MRKVYTHQNMIWVGMARNVLHAQGIKTCVRNEYAAGAAGELSFIQAWPELWVMQDRDYDRACEIVGTALSSADASDWTCTACEEANDASFELCWNCAGVPPAGG